MVDKVKDACPWCKWARNAKVKKCNESDCDFKTLLMTKMTILSRLEKEAKEVHSLKVKIGHRRMDMTRAAADIIDKATGMKIMMDVLKADFGMSDASIKEAVEFPKLTIAQKALFVGALKSVGVDSDGT